MGPVERARAPGRACITAAVAIAALGGCALTISGPAKGRPRNERPVCDTGKGFVATDTILGAVMGVTALGVLGGNDPEVALLPGVLGAAFILSAISGNGRANDCREAIAEYEGGADRRPLPDEDDTAATRAAALRGAPRDDGPPRAGVGAGRRPAAVAPPRAGAAPLPAAAPSPAAPPDAEPPDATPPDAAPPAAAPPAAAPAPSPRKPPPPSAPTPPPAPPPDRWTDFWKELP
jgi:hypothetical protein